MKYPNIDFRNRGKHAYFQGANHEILSQKEELALLTRYHDSQTSVEEKIAIRNELVEKNIRLCVSFVEREFRNKTTYYTDGEDLVQTATIGLMTAIDMYDFSKGSRLSTYSIWRMRLETGIELRLMERQFKIPQNIFNMLPKFKTFYESYIEEHGDVPSNKLIKQTFSLNSEKSVVQLIETYKRHYQASSLDSEISNESDRRTDLHSLVGDRSNSVESQVEKKDLHNQIQALLEKCLTQQECEILTMRFGLANNPMYKLDDIGAKYSISKERVRQIEKNALNKLKQSSLATHMLSEYAM